LENCPLCRRDIRELINHHIPLMITRKLDELKVICPNCETPQNRGVNSSHIARCFTICSIGCGKKLKPIEQQKHEVECLAEVINCPAKDVMCPWTGARSTVPDHLKSCLYQQLRPAFEAVFMKVYDLKAQLEMQTQKTKRFLEFSLRYQKYCQERSNSNGYKPTLDLSGLDLHELDFKGEWFDTIDFRGADLQNVKNIHCEHAIMNYGTKRSCNSCGSGPIYSPKSFQTANCPKELSKGHTDGLTYKTLSEQ